MRVKNKSSKKRIILVISLIIFLVLIACIIFKCSNSDSKIKLEEKNNNSEVNDIIKDDEHIVKDNINDNENTIVDDKSDNNIVEKQEEKQKITNQEQPNNTNVETSKENVKVEEQTSISETPKETPKQENNIWDELGITEDEYYNSPAWKWAKVDFHIDEYGSQENCLNACIEYGESTGMGYSCSTINSYSGRYLGEMIKLF